LKEKRREGKAWEANERRAMREGMTSPVAYLLRGINTLAQLSLTWIGTRLSIISCFVASASFIFALDCFVYAVLYRNGFADSAVWGKAQKCSPHTTNEIIYFFPSPHNTVGKLSMFKK